MLNKVLALLVLGTAIFLALYYNSNDSSKSSGCPFTKASAGGRSLLASTFRMLGVPISWVKYLKLLHIYDEEIAIDVSSIDLPICMAQPFVEKDLVKGKHMAFLGQVYDVSTYPEMYGKGSGYEYLTGFEATREMAITAFPETVEENRRKKNRGFALDGLDTFHLNEIMTWMSLFKSKYKCVGFIPGVFYHEMGEPTDYLKSLLKLWSNTKKLCKDLLAKTKPCFIKNIDGSDYRSCDGLANDNTKPMVPRELLLPIESSPRCVCVPLTAAHPTLMRPFPGCDPKVMTCKAVPNKNDFDWSKLREPIVKKKPSTK